MPKKHVSIEGIKFEPMCQCCRSEFRGEIYDLYVNQDYSGRQIVEWLGQKGFKVSRSAVLNHTSKHIGSKIDIIKAKSTNPHAIQTLIEAGELPNATPRQLLETVIAVGMRHASEATLTNAIQASKLLHEMQKEERDNFLEGISKMIVKSNKVKITREIVTVEPQKIIDVQPDAKVGNIAGENSQGDPALQW